MGRPRALLHHFYVLRFSTLRTIGRVEKVILLCLLVSLVAVLAARSKA